MRRYFRFSVRDLLWLTLVVALALGWFVHQRQLGAEADEIEIKAAQAGKLASQWQTGARYLAGILGQDGTEVCFDLELSHVLVKSPDRLQGYNLDCDYPPSGYHASFWVKPNKASGPARVQSN